MRSTLLALSLVTALLAVTAAQGGKLYRWVDEEGNVHYTDKIPPEQSERGHQELSDQGVRTQVVPRAKTKEEIAREQELKQLRAEQQRLIEKQKAEDRVLLRSFRSEDDLILARDGKLAAIDAQVKVIQGNIRRYQSYLSNLQSRAATVERTGTSPPPRVLGKIEKTLQNVNRSYAAIERKEQVKTSIRERFAQDLKRFRELKNLTPKQPEVEEQQTHLLPNLVSCSNQEECGRVWEKAEAFVRANATTSMQMIGENIVMTAAPTKDEDISITVSRIVNPETGRIILFMDLFCKNTPIGKEFCNSEHVETIRTKFRSELGVSSGPD